MSNVTHNNNQQSNHYWKCVFQSDNAQHGVGNLNNDKISYSMSSNNNDELHDIVDGTGTTSANSREVLGVLSKFPVGQ